MSDNIIHDLGSAEDETNEFYHKWLDRKAEAEALRSELESSRGRVAELEQQLASEKKCHRLANTMRFQQEDRDRARIAELEAQDKKIAELEKQESLSGYWSMFDELIGKGWSAIRANAFTVAKATFDLTQRGFLKDARIAELESQVAELTLEADRHVEEITHLRNEGKQDA